MRRHFAAAKNTIKKPTKTLQRAWEAFLEELGEPAQRQMMAAGIQFSWGDGQHEDNAPAAASAASASQVAATSAADMKSNVFRMKKEGFDISKHIALRKEATATYVVVALAEEAATVKEKLHGDLTGEELAMTGLRPARRH